MIIQQNPRLLISKEKQQKHFSKIVWISTRKTYFHHVYRGTCDEQIIEYSNYLYRSQGSKTPVQEVVISRS